MTPATTWFDPIFRTYAAIVLCLLLAAGAVLSLLQLVFRMRLASVWKTYRSWLVMAPVVALAILAGRVPFVLGVTALSLAAASEFARVSELAGDRWMTRALYAAIILTGGATLLGLDPGLAAIGAVLLLALVPILRDRPGLRSFSLGLVALVFLGWFFGELGSLANRPHACSYLCFLLFATAVTDVAGFVFGKIFGRHPLRSGISPQKTWEGAVGALAVAFALPWLLRFSFPFFGARQLDLIGLIVGLGGPLGDLSGSALKREFGVKDWSAAIPGHGGVLDRVDSLIFVAPLFMLMASYYDPGR